MLIILTIMKVLTVEDKVTSVGIENEPRVDIADTKSTKEELNRLVIVFLALDKSILAFVNRVNVTRIKYIVNR